MTDKTHNPQRRAALLMLAGLAAADHAAAAAAGLKFWPFDRRSSRSQLLIAGTRAMYPLNQLLVAGFLKANSNIDVVVESGGSLSALIALKRGSVDIAAMSRDLKDSEEESNLTNCLIARNGVGIVVGPGIKLPSLSSAQVRALLSGQVGNWSRLGGPNAAVQVVSRERGSTSRLFVEDVILGGGDIAPNAMECDSVGKLTQVVADTPYAIGFMSLQNKPFAVPVTHVKVDGVEDSRETLLSGRYPYTQSLYLAMLKDPQSPAKRFVDFVCSAAGQKIVDTANMVGTY